MAMDTSSTPVIAASFIAASRVATAIRTSPLIARKDLSSTRGTTSATGHHPHHHLVVDREKQVGEPAAGELQKVDLLVLVKVDLDPDRNCPLSDQDQEVVKNQKEDPLVPEKEDQEE